ncbi:hypothetical protein ABH37_00625 [Mycobacterium haemophilum]|uniref:Uncharacterized protein n=1 Tax=Mycobacterium haemophilum TaxID=29311 RepID=A0A0I9VKA3_9MYCO|nr:hypothetical protein ABH39_00625 [Mycobacterium haemophilum]KLO39242.1 hypothetical protein ABH38_00625 [Mycobacterium haemophilum]KLO45548.1 hypothetical protein ABH37_00625 [Mycobacterium haemophilum]KLO56700.1 hypothetical protein ABH36_00625 [Mycobacterium haemophilum]
MTLRVVREDLVVADAAIDALTAGHSVSVQTAVGLSESGSEHAVVVADGAQQLGRFDIDAAESSFAGAACRNR